MSSSSFCRAVTYVVFFFQTFYDSHRINSCERKKILFILTFLRKHVVSWSDDLHVIISITRIEFTRVIIDYMNLVTLNK